MTPDATSTGLPASGARAWLRPAALLVVAMTTAVVQPSVLLGVPFLVLGFALGVGRWGVLAAAALAMAVVVGGGVRDGLWYVERGWALLAGGWFAALTLRRPSAPFSVRALGAVAGAAGAAALLLAARAGAWNALEWAVEDRMGRGLSTALEALRVIRGGDAVPPALAAAVYETVQMQARVFPALMGISTMAALGVAWWLYVRLSSGSQEGLGPLREFRFNDHLVWVFILGLVLLVASWGGALGSVGANAVVFMGALYAVRGAAVIMFLSGGLSLAGYALLAFGLIFLPPLVLTGAMVIGIGDTWLDVRGRARARSA